MFFNYSKLHRSRRQNTLSYRFHSPLLVVSGVAILDYLDLGNNDFLALQFDYLHNHNCHNLSILTSPLRCVNSSTLRHLDLSYNSNLAIKSLQWLPYISSLEYLNLRSIDLSKETNWLQLVTMLPSLHSSICVIVNLRT